MINKLMKSRKEKLLAFLHEENYAGMTVNELAFLFQVPPQEKELLDGIVEDLLKEGKAVLTKKGKLMPPESLQMFYGAFIGNARGYGFVRTDTLDEDIFIPPSAVNGAMHKDKVLCRVTSANPGEKRKEGEIIRVVEKGVPVVVGTFRLTKRGQRYVEPDDKKIAQDIAVKPAKSKGAADGQKVTVRITKPAEGGKKAVGTVTEILGNPSDPGIDVLSIILKHDLPLGFSSKINKALKDISETISEEEIKNRTDFRQLQTVTIDGEDAKDLDDAVSLETLSNGNYRLGVHIADVSHYVKENAAIDQEAQKRGTSVYLVDRVIPMLPQKLSNGLCSLNPKEDRLALSVLMEIDAKGAVVSHTVCESVIHSDCRLTYTAVNEILTNPASVYTQEYKPFVPMLLKMGALSLLLREKRIARGAIEFGFAESKIILDENGKPIEIKPYIRNSATSLIEEFMLVCNETIAEEYFWLELPFVFRTHEEPDPEKMKTLSDFIHKFGYHLKGTGAHPKAIQNLLSSAGNTPEQMLISRVALRSLKQARYTVTNEGHFGLAAKYYCHFTSPIRRYPDLQIHRIIKKTINEGFSEEEIEALNDRLPEICRHSSRAERAADEAEREVEALKKAQFMVDKIGETFTGLISGLSKWWIYVTLPNTVEGTVSPADLSDDYYIFDEQNMYYIGERTKKTYGMGDPVAVVLTRVLASEGKIEFMIAEQL